jgi:hypothetical protein
MTLLEQMQELEQKVADMRIILAFEKGIKGVTPDEYLCATARLREACLSQRRCAAENLTDYVAARGLEGEDS